MWLRCGINDEPRIGTVWNVPTHGKFWRPLQHHLEARQGNLRNSDTAPGAIAGGHFQIISSAGPLLILENLESFKRGAEKNAQRPVEYQSKNPVRYETSNFVPATLRTAHALGPVASSLRPSVRQPW
jgi:hypothetical protein